MGTTLAETLTAPHAESYRESLAERSRTLVTNLYGGPGTGKSTTRAQVFARLKQLGVNAEEAPEYAKDLTWEQRHFTLTQQEYVFSKQMHRIQRLIGQVEVIVTDSPILFSLIYAEPPRPTIGGRINADWTRFEAWREYVVSVHRSWRTIDCFLMRDPHRPYNPAGRNQDEQEAKLIDGRIRDLLRQYAPEIHPSMAYRVAQVDKDNDTHVDQIVGMVLDALPSRG